MHEDGIYVSYFPDDTQKAKDPRSVVSIQNSKVNIMINPKTDEDTKKYLNGIVDRLSKASSKDDYEEIAYMSLGKYWESNGYTPNPSDFFEIGSDGANTSLQTAREWAAAK